MIRYAQIQRRLLAALSTHPEICAVMVGLRPGSELNTRPIPESAGLLIGDRQAATFEAIAQGRSSGAPARTPLSAQEAGELRETVFARLPADIAGSSAMRELADARSQCTYSRAWWDLDVTLPPETGARAVTGFLLAYADAKRRSGPAS